MKHRVDVTNEDQGRLEWGSSYRVKLFKETRRQGALDALDAGRSPREEWDRRQSARTRFALIRKGEGVLE